MKKILLVIAIAFTLTATVVVGAATLGSNSINSDGTVTLSVINASMTCTEKVKVGTLTFYPGQSAVITVSSVTSGFQISVISTTGKSATYTGSQSEIQTIFEKFDFSKSLIEYKSGIYCQTYEYLGGGDHRTSGLSELVKSKDKILSVALTAKEKKTLAAHKVDYVITKSTEYPTGFYKNGITDNAEYTIYAGSANDLVKYTKSLIKKIS